MGRFGARTLQSKIFLYVIPFLVIPSLLSYYILDGQLERNIEDKVGKTMQQSLNLVRFNMDRMLGEMMNAMTLMTLDADLLRALQNGGRGYEMYKSANTVFKNAIGVILGSIEYRMMIIAGHPAEHYFASGHNPNFNLDRLANSDWYTQLMQNPPAFVWRYDEEDESEKILLARALVDYPGNRRLGAAIVSIPYPAFTSILEQLEGEVFLLSDQGRLSMEPGFDADSPSAAVDESLLERMQHQRRGQFSAVIEGEKHMINYDTLQANGWKIVQKLSYDEVFREISNVRRINLMIIVAIFSVFTLIMYLLSRRIARPLRLLKMKMSQLSDAKLSSYLPVPTRNQDEIADLIEAYNRMLRQIKDLLANLQQEQRHKEDMRFKALQAQMNPHFILNTINNIKWLAYMRQDHGVAEMITSLAVMIEGSIGRGEDRIPLRQEIAYIESYVNLHKIKLSDSLTLECDIPDDCMDCGIIKFSLQPLVENSILHGFGRTPSDGSIRITARIEDDALIIRVVDNGCGIPAHKLAELQDNLRDARTNVHHERLGLLSLHERLRLTFGDGYGLWIENRAEGGCQVTVTGPAIELTERGRKDWDDAEGIDRR